MKSWYDLSEKEQDMLEEEFEKKNEFKSYDNPVMISVLYIVGTLMAVFGYAIKDTNDLIGYMMMLVGIIIYFIASYYVFMMLLVSREREKQFVSWLKVSKHIIKEKDYE